MPRVKTDDQSLEKAYVFADAIDAARIPLHRGMRLGEIIDELAGIDENEPVEFDFGGCQPNRLDSYRGYYSDLAIGYTNDEDGWVVGKLRSALTEAVGSVFEGYKGGDYRMGRETPVWVANYGRSHGVAVVRVERQSWRVVLHTAMID